MKSRKSQVAMCPAAGEVGGIFCVINCEVLEAGTWTGEKKEVITNTKFTLDEGWELFTMVWVHHFWTRF